jgi:haloacetate dehalogenase
MAKDLRALMTTLGIEKIALVGHDRGARVTTRFAKDRPEAIDRLVVPTAYWFFLFHLVPDLPEAPLAW